MNEVKRYYPETIEVQSEMLEDSSGGYVRWEDYEALRSNAIRLKEEVNEARKGSGEGMKVMLNLNNELVDEISRLKAYIDDIKKSHFEEVQKLTSERKSACYINDAWYVPISELKAKESDYNLLKAENERMMTTPTSRLLREERKEVERLKVEIKRLEDVIHSPHPSTEGWILASKERDLLRAENERLRNAGDAMANEISKHLTYNEGLGKTNNWWKETGRASKPLL